MTRKFVTTQKRLIRDAAFAQRLNEACDNHSDCPALHYGRLSWLVKSLKDRFSVTISTEAVRKWIAGEVRPRPAVLARLAEVLEVDLAWLAIGSEGETSQGERKARNAMADAAVNLVAGMIAMDGGHPAFPDPNDSRASSVDLYAIIKGAQYSFKILVGQHDGAKSWAFAAPTSYRDVFVLGLVRTGPFQWDVLELDTDTISKRRQSKSGHITIRVDKRGADYILGGQKIRRLEAFTDRP